ncbi:MAG: hypothetical protein FD175_2890 [Beijerinckiaceae bacterium]|nr:MAG: hypothetical protein FD175_2890 [Beijerinckiaceae bacterium]
MNKRETGKQNAVGLAFVKAQLVCAQSLEIMLEKLLVPISGMPEAGEICEILEETANIYLNISERISALRADDSIFIPMTEGDAGQTERDADGGGLQERSA